MTGLGRLNLVSIQGPPPDLTYFGIVVTLNCMIDLITPPYGLLLTRFPRIMLFLPHAFGYQ